MYQQEKVSLCPLNISKKKDANSMYNMVQFLNLCIYLKAYLNLCIYTCKQYMQGLCKVYIYIYSIYICAIYIIICDIHSYKYMHIQVIYITANYIYTIIHIHTYMYNCIYRESLRERKA